MSFKLFALLLFLGLSCCNAQEQLTCLRSSPSPTGFSTFNNNATGERLQGPPSKKGPIGARGGEGMKGQKGDPGIPDNSVVEHLRREITALKRRLESEVSAIRNGFQRLDDGWIGIFNGYQYKLSSARQSYEEGRQFCKRNGADLAVHGVQDMENRRIFRTALNPIGSTYIGMNDIDNEGTWKWVDGDLVSDAGALWKSGQPNGGNDEDCGIIYHLLAYDEPCDRSGGLQALCEKPWK